MQKLDKVFKSLLYVLPVVLFFSYYPIISLGSNESMNFELSLPLIWLLVFDVLGFVMFVCDRMVLKKLKGCRWWLWLLFPVWISISLIWSLNKVRGFLTVGILWLLYFAGFTIWSFRKLLNKKFWTRWWRWFLGASVLVGIWCLMQCVLNIMGVSKDYSLMCDGCTYNMFGFPHPNGFAIEPQFMGNLLLAPIIVSLYLIVKDDSKSSLWDQVLERRKKQALLISGRRLLIQKTILSTFLLVILFLTFSRGAIYALVVGIMFMSGYAIFGVKGLKRKRCIRRVGMVWITIVFSFVIALNIQGLMAEVGPTSDTYYDGVAKVLNHLSLGVIDVRGKRIVENTGEKDGNIEGELKNDDYALVENSVKNDVGNSVENFKEEAIFDGYVSESTDTRVKLTGAALNIWSKDTNTVFWGVGLGGAGQALYQNGLSPAPKEIVQNEYASLLLETGLIGFSLFLLTTVLVVRVIWKNSMKMLILSLLLAYGVSLMFFSGLPNALHIYLMPILLVML